MTCFSFKAIYKAILHKLELTKQNKKHSSPNQFITRFSGDNTIRIGNEMTSSRTPPDLLV